MVRLKNLVRPAPRLLGGALVLGAVACDVPELKEQRLADLRSATMQVAWSSEGGSFDDAANRWGSWVTVTFKGAPDCFTFAPEVRATVAGREMELVPAVTKPDFCGVTVFQLKLSDGLGLTDTPEDDVVELRDGQDVFRATLKGLTARRGFTRLENRLYPTPLSAGETLVYHWIPQTDRFVEEHSGNPDAAFLLRGERGSPISFQHIESPISGDLTFEVPLPGSLPEGFARAMLEGEAQIPVVACEGPAACEARANFRGGFAAEVGSP